MAEILTPETDKQILQRMLNTVPNDLDKREGSFIWDSLSPASIELAWQKSAIGYIVQRVFAKYAEDEWLDRIAADYGLERGEGESNESLRNRVLSHRATPERGGGDEDYERWALSVTGVQWAKSIDKARGLGTVDVVVAGPPEQLPNLVQLVQEKINLKKVSGVDAKAKPVNVVNTNFVINIYGLDTATAHATAMEYLESIGVGGRAVLAHLVTALVKKGAEDAVVIEPTSNVILPPDSILVPVVTIQ